MKNIRITSTKFLLTGSLVILTLLITGVVYAAEFNWKYATYVGPTHPLTKADQTWAEWVEKNTSGRIKIQIFSGGTLMPWRQSYSELSKGIADAAVATGEYSPGFKIAKRLPSPKISEC